MTPHSLISTLFPYTTLFRSTGPLGQGVANSVGMAIAERWLAAHFNKGDQKLVDYRVYAICGDGDLMEGVSQDRKSTRLNSSQPSISYAVFCLKKKNSLVSWY